MRSIERALWAIGAAAGTFLVGSTARAEDKDGLADRGHFVVSADRLVPLFSWTRVAQDDLNNANASTTTTETSFSLLWGSTPGQEVFFSVPRAGFDYTVLPRFTVGGDLIVFFTAGTSFSRTTPTANNGSTTTNNGNGGQFVFGIAPRVGYLMPLGNLPLYFWGRGGFSFYTATNTNDGATVHNNVNQLAFDLEPTLVWTPVTHFGLTASIDGDVPLYGRHSTTTFGNNGQTVTDFTANSSEAFFGITLGMLGYL